jgi:hypothetical protein
MDSEYRIPEANPKGGLDLINDEKSKSVVMEILKSLGRKIMEGNFTDIMKISRPASISFPMSFLQAASRDFSYTHYLSQAALVDNHVIRMQLICSFIVSGLHINPVEFKNNPPLNPILGETFTAEMRDGSKIWLEQTCHHPPITHWHMEGPNNLFKFTGYGQIRAGLSGPNTIKASKLGKHLIEFNNGDQIEYTAPNMKISGIVLGQRNVNFEGTFEVIDKKNHLKALFQFEQDPGMISSFAGKIKGFWSKKEKLPSDFFKVKIGKLTENGSFDEICDGIGSWLQYLQFGERIWWNSEMKPFESWKRSDDHLPSDSSYREDLNLLLSGDLVRAQAEKERLENIQRRDKMLRTGLIK